MQIVWYKSYFQPVHSEHYYTLHWQINSQLINSFNPYDNTVTQMASSHLMDGITEAQITIIIGN